MHFVTGGAYNGKSRWVKETYNLDAKEHVWLSAYKDDPLLFKADHDSPAIIVLKGPEKWIKNELSLNTDSDQLTAALQKKFDKWLNWERQQEQHQLIIIGTDITKGVVPIDSKDRIWRDITGWVYQYLAKHASRMDVIWYGISESMK